ncbi:MAG TPA: phosphoribosyl-ATP diphosphatase, partial [Candidatus Acidoferrum sp.]|nr:phosphoribosyl-ATP diphosphatase [Candidatus Acidoferrum sp.]
AEEAPDGATFATALAALARTIASRKAHPVEGSYTAKLFAGGVDRIGKKIGEEATEVVIAAKNDDRAELVWETADLLYHTLVILAERGVALDQVGAELSRRAKPAE